MNPSLLLLAAIAAQVSPVTPQQEAQLQAALSDVKAMDKELDTITKNQEYLRSSIEARHEEISSLLIRYPQLPITRTSTLEEVYKALYRHRMERGASVRHIADQKLAYGKQESCVAFNRLKESRRELEESDAYKTTPLQDRLDLRKAFDDVMQNYGVDCPPM